MRHLYCTMTAGVPPLQVLLRQNLPATLIGAVDHRPLPIADGKSSPAAACSAWEDSSMCSDYAWEFAEGIYPPSGTSIRSAESSSALSRSTTQFADQIAPATTAASNSISLSPVECTSSSTESAGSLDAPDSRHGLEIAQGTDQSSTSRGAWELALDEIFRALLF